MRKSTVFTGALCFTVFAAGLSINPPMADAASPPTMAPHRAVYDLNLKSARARSGVQGVSGRLAIEVTGASCLGWTVNVRLVNRFVLPRGKQRFVDVRSTSFEAGDSTTLSYFEKEYVDSRLNKTIRLKANRDAAEVIERLPKPGKFRLPANAYFPVAHQLHLIAKARTGTFRDKAYVYDGSDHREIYEAIAFIGKPRAEKLPEQKTTGGGTDTLLKGTRVWPVTVSFFAVNGTRKDTPNHQLSFNMYENGISADLVIDYGDFSLSGKLRHLEKLPVSDCEQKQ